MIIDLWNYLSLLVKKVKFRITEKVWGRKSFKSSLGAYQRNFFSKKDNCQVNTLWVSCRVVNYSFLPTNLQTTN